MDKIEDDSFAKLLNKKAQYLRIKNALNVDSDDFQLGDKIVFQNSSDICFEVVDIQIFGNIEIPNPATVLFLYEPDGLEV